MTHTDQDRQKRQMNRRIREVLAIRRTLAAVPQPDVPEPEPSKDLSGVPI